jgi:uncharacterized caspase-like protein
MSAVYQRKKALIIGIDNYHQNSLKYCVNDAEDLKVALDNMGFNVSLGLDCNKTEFYQKIDTFVQEIKSTDLTLFYFAGHGKQSDDKNYLLPSDYDYNHRRSEEKYLMKHAVNIQYITKAIDDKNCCITIYIFDCCRNFLRTRDNDIRQGLSPMYTPPETLIVYSCSPGKAALDETINDRNGIFTGILLKHIAKPHNDIEEVLKNVARDVKNQTNGFQLPYRTTSLTDNVCLLAENKQG